MKKKFLSLVFISLLVLSSFPQAAHAGFDGFKQPSYFIDCNNPSVNVAVNLLAGAEENKYLGRLSASGNGAESVKVNDGAPGQPGISLFNIPADLGVGLIFQVSATIAVLQALSGPTSVTLLAEPGDSRTSAQGFGTASTTLELRQTGCGTVSPPKDDPGEKDPDKDPDKDKNPDRQDPDPEEDELDLTELQRDIFDNFTEVDFEKFQDTLVSDEKPLIMEVEVKVRKSLIDGVGLSDDEIADNTETILKLLALRYKKDDLKRKALQERKKQVRAAANKALKEARSARKSKAEQRSARREAINKAKEDSKTQGFGGLLNTLVIKIGDGTEAEQAARKQAILKGTKAEVKKVDDGAGGTKNDIKDGTDSKGRAVKCIGLTVEFDASLCPKEDGTDGTAIIDGGAVRRFADDAGSSTEGSDEEASDGTIDGLLPVTIQEPFRKFATGSPRIRRGKRRGQRSGVLSIPLQVSFPDSTTAE